MGLRADLTACRGESEESWEALRGCGFGGACDGDGGGVEGEDPAFGSVEDVGVDFVAQFAGETEEGGGWGVGGVFHFVYLGGGGWGLMVELVALRWRWCGVVW